MFPQKSKIFKRPIGWKDLGAQRKTHFIENGKSLTMNDCHKLCGKRVHIGKENEELFMFCPRCLIKIIQQYVQTKPKRKEIRH